MKFLPSLASLLALTALTQAKLTCAPVFRDHVVLQQGVPVPVWGTASAGSAVKVTFDGQSLGTMADDQGNWKLRLSPLAADQLEDFSKASAGKNL
ncbi:MAG: sialate O-acetylesterase, partial [Luteolibacter sp.]